MTSHGIYCYKVMPFRLKNIDLTYQHLVNAMFAKLLGQTIEVHNNDILVKSLVAEQHIAYLEQTFTILQRYNMKLNHAKCSFRVSSVKFLGYIVTQ